VFLKIITKVRKSGKNGRKWRRIFGGWLEIYKKNGEKKN